MIGDSETDANAAKAAEIPIILLKYGYTEKRSEEIYHNHIIKDFVGIEKIVSEYLKKNEIKIEVDLNLGKFVSKVWTCDLTKKYIEINADYRS